SFLTIIEKRDSIEAGYALSYYGNTEIGRLVSASKYKNAGPFAEKLVSLAVDVVRARYPSALDGVVSVPSTRSGNLVEIFARSVAHGLGMPYISELMKRRLTQEQKSLTN